MERATKRAKVDEEAEEDGVDACTALRFHLLSPGAGAAAKMAAAASFAPEMCHQVFGDDEKVYGWSDVPGFQIDIWLSQSNYSSMLEVLPEGKRRPEGATDVAEALSKWFPGGSVQRQREVFQVAAAEPLDLTQLGGEVLEVPAASPPRSDGHGAIQDGSTAVYRHRLSEANSYVKELHSRIQPMLIFFIDACNFLEDAETGEVDPRWEVYLAVRREGEHHIVVGMATTFEFYAFPDRTRLRLSQIFVPPPHQHRGVGRALLLAVYVTAVERDALDVTVEDPAPQLKTLRDRLDLQRLAALPWLTAHAERVARSLAASQAGANGAGGAKSLAAAISASSELRLPDQLAVRAQRQLKICVPQVRRLWEVLLLRQRGIGDAEHGQVALAGWVSRRVRDSLTQTQRRAVDKRFLARFEKEREVGFAMLRVAPGSRVGQQPALEDGVQPSEEELSKQVGETVAAQLEEIEALAEWLQKSGSAQSVAS